MTSGGNRAFEGRITDHRLPLVGGEIFAREWCPDGASLKAPLLLLHDSLGCVELWRDFPPRLARATGRVVYAYDRLGFGASSAREDVPTAAFVDEEARDELPQVAAHLGLDEMILVGHSVGGGMAITAAAQPRMGRSVRAVITLAAQAFVEERTRDGIRAAARTFAEPAHMQRLERYHGAKASWVLRAWVDVWLSDAFASWALDSHLAALRCPVLAIHGDRDEFGSLAFPRRIVEGVRGGWAEMVVLERCAHVPHRERPKAVLAAIDAFLQTNDV